MQIEHVSSQFYPSKWVIPPKFEPTGLSGGAKHLRTSRNVLKSRNPQISRIPYQGVRFFKRGVFFQGIALIPKPPPKRMKSPHRRTRVPSPRVAWTSASRRMEISASSRGYTEMRADPIFDWIPFGKGSHLMMGFTLRSSTSRGPPLMSLD